MHKTKTKYDADPEGFNRGEKIFSSATYIIERAINGSTSLDEGFITL